jgi:hypothetical protein
MSTLYPRLPRTVTQKLYLDVRDKSPIDLTRRWTPTHDAQFFAATGGGRATPAKMKEIRQLICSIAEQEGFPDRPIGREVNDFDAKVAQALHRHLDLVPAEAAVRQVWAFLALVLLPDVAVWRYPDPPKDRLLDTDITRHVFGRLWWRAELLYDRDGHGDPYHLLNVFQERAFDRILARRKSLGGSPELVRALAKEWSVTARVSGKQEVLEEALKHLMRRGAFQDLFGLPEGLLRSEVSAVIEIAAEHRRSLR